MRWALALALLLTGCAGGQDARTFPDDTRQVYLNLAGELLPTWTDAQLTDQAVHVCTTLDGQPDATGWVQLVKGYTDDGMPARDAGALVTYAVGTLCREHLPALPAGGGGS